MRPSHTLRWAIVFFVALCCGAGLVAPAAFANDGEGTEGDLYVGSDEGRGTSGGPPIGDDDGGLEADPDTFSVDSWTWRDVVLAGPWTPRDVLQRGLGWALHTSLFRIFRIW